MNKGENRKMFGDKQYTDRKNRKEACEKVIPALAILLPPVSYLLLGLTGLEEKGMLYIRIGILFVTLLTLLALMASFWNEKAESGEKARKIVQCILAMGILLRISYMLYTPCDIRYHDLGEINGDSFGHAAYLLNLMEKGQLPQSNDGQFYQQPLFYVLGSVVSWVLNGIRGTSDAWHLVDAAKVLSCIASCGSLLISGKIFEECGLSGKGLYRALLLVAFLPVYFLTGGSVGVDALTGLFMLLALLYTLRWRKDQSWKNTLLLALIYGCGMMTKISCATMALVTALVFFRSLWQAGKKHAAGSLLWKYLVFGCISLPLGLWYSIRNYLLFGQSLTYVLKMSEENPLYTGNLPILRRILLIQVSNLWESPYADVYTDYNLPVYALKSALFGEFHFSCWQMIPVLLLIFACLLSVLCVLGMADCMIHQGKEPWCRLLFFAAVFFYGSIVVFYVKYPFGCSMDFRYMLFLPVPIAGLFGKSPLFQRKIWGILADSCCLGFAVLSAVMYLSFR